MAKPIDLGLVLEGEDAVDFWENEKKSQQRNKLRCSGKQKRYTVKNCDVTPNRSRSVGYNY